MEKICQTCAMYVQEQQGCVRTKTIEVPNHTCRHWAHQLPTCATCGLAFVPPVNYMLVEDAYITICPSCLNQSGTCGLCKGSARCDFQENPIAIPPLVEKTVRQGNRLITGNIPNPDRIAATCVASGCKCYHKDEEHEWCCRQFGCCGNYEMKDVKIERNETNE